MSIEGQGHFLILAQACVHTKNTNWIFSETTVSFWTKLRKKAFRYKEMKIWWHDAGHMTKMAATPLYSKNSSKIFFSGTCWPISTKLGMHWGLKLIIVWSNYDPWVTLTYLTASSNLVTGGRTGLMVRASDSGSGDPGSILGRVGVFVSLSKRHLLPKSTGNTQE